MNELEKWVLTIVSATVAAYFGSMLALRKTKQEKVWLLKQEAYFSIIESFHDLISWANAEYSDHFPVPLPTVNKETLEKLNAKQQESLLNLDKHIALGGLVISHESTDNLKTILSEYYEEKYNFFDENFYDHEAPEMFSNHFHKIRSIFENHLESVKELAAKDLNI